MLEPVIHEIKWNHLKVADVLVFDDGAMYSVRWSDIENWRATLSLPAEFNTDFGVRSAKRVVSLRQSTHDGCSIGPKIPVFIDTRAELT